MRLNNTDYFDSNGYGDYCRVTYYPSGRVKSKRWFKDKKEIQHIIYNENGNIESVKWGL